MKLTEHAHCSVVPGTPAASAAGMDAATALAARAPASMETAAAMPTHQMQPGLQNQASAADGPATAVPASGQGASASHAGKQLSLEGTALPAAAAAGPASAGASAPGGAPCSPPSCSTPAAVPTITGPGSSASPQDMAAAAVVAGSRAAHHAASTVHQLPSLQQQVQQVAVQQQQPQEQPQQQPQQQKQQEKGNKQADRGKQRQRKPRASTVYHQHPWSWPGLPSTTSFRALTTVGGTHQFAVQGYSLARSLDCGARICSDLFDAGGQAFRLEVYPAGLTADCVSHIGVFLTTPGAADPSHVLFEIAILDQSGGGRHLARSSKPCSQPLYAPFSGVVAGFPRFARAAALEKRGARYLAGDRIVFRVTVELVRSWSSAPGQMLQPGQLMQPPGQLLQPVPGMITAPGAHLLPLQGSHPAIASQPPAWDATNNQGAPVPCCGLTAAGGGCCSPIGQPTKEQQQQQQQQVLHQQCVHFGRAAAHARCCCCAARRAAAGACDTAAAALPNAALMHFKQQQQQEVEEGSNRLMVGLGAQQGHPMPGSSGGCSPGCQSCCRSDAPLPSSARVVRAPAPASAAAASRQAAAGQLLGSCHPRSSSQLD